MIRKAISTKESATYNTKCITVNEQSNVYGGHSKSEIHLGVKPLIDWEIIFFYLAEFELQFLFSYFVVSQKPL